MQRLSSRRTSGKKPLAFVLHSLFGLKLSLLVLFVSFTGTIAVVSDEIEWLASAKFRASATDRRASWQTQYEAIRVAFPIYQTTYITAGEEPYLATRILATSPSGETRIVYVDPATGKVNGDSGFITFRSFVRALHYLLFTPDDWGFYMVSGLGFLLLGSMLTGLFVYKKFWRGFFSMPRTDRGPRVFWGNLHKLLALWSLWFVVIMALTSIWYFGERILYRFDIDFEGHSTALNLHELPSVGPLPPARRSLDELVARAQEALPGLDVKRIVLPSANEAVYIEGQASAWFVRDRTNSVAINPYTGAVLSVRRAEDMPIIERWVHTADLLHFGDFGGLWFKLVWGLVRAHYVRLGRQWCLGVREANCQGAVKDAPRNFNRGKEDSRVGHVAVFGFLGTLEMAQYRLDYCSAVLVFLSLVEARL
ncbi:MAG: PepSY-associated TM helix domain-containing protein [Candidatus Binatia bacterium]